LVKIGDGYRQVAICPKKKGVEAIVGGVVEYHAEYSKAE
jgi:hypothetical protein